MIIKARSIQFNLLSHAALRKRVSPLHPKFPIIERNFYMARAGLMGEEYVDTQLAQYHHAEPHLIVQDLHLKAASYFQIDHLFLTQSYALIIEVKNIRGIVELKQHPFHMVRTNESGIITMMDSPEEQLEKNIIWFRDWLQKRKWSLPVCGVIVFTNSDSQIIANQASYEIIRPKYMTKKIRKMSTHQVVLRKDQLLELGNEIVANHKPFIPLTMVDKYGLTIEDILPGVECPTCHEIGMERKNRQWMCSQNHISKDAHIATIQDYFLIFGNYITNPACRRFLQVDDKHVVSRILKNMKLKESGKSRWRVYERS